MGGAFVTSSDTSRAPHHQSLACLSAPALSRSCCPSPHQGRWTEKPADGVYCFGMHLDGCAWDEGEHSLCESKPKVLYAPCPGIHMVPAQVKDFKVVNHYLCPLYKTADRRGILSTTGHSTNFVMDIRVPCSQDPDHWIRRGACMLLSLKD